MRSGRKRLIVLGGGVTGERQDTLKGIQRGAESRTRGCACLCVCYPASVFCLLAAVIT